MCFSSISFSRPPGQMRGGLGPSASRLLPERYPQAAITLCQDVKNPRPPPSDVSPSVTPPPPAPVSASDAECPEQSPLRREKGQLRHSLSFSCWGNGGPRGGGAGTHPVAWRPCSLLSLHPQLLFSLLLEAEPLPASSCPSGTQFAWAAPGTMCRTALHSPPHPQSPQRHHQNPELGVPVVAQW